MDRNAKSGCLSKLTIRVAETARNFADCINRAHYQNVSFVLLRNGSPVARIVPDREKICLGRDLAAAVTRAALDNEEARDWRHDLKAGRKALKKPADKWE